MGAPRIESFGHIDLTVTDGERSVSWWTQVLGFRLITSFGRRGFRVWSLNHPCGFPLGLVVHDTAPEHPFDERVVGLDHFAFRVRDRAALEQWADHLDELGIDHSGVQEENGGPLITLRDPDNIQVELWAFDPDLVVLGEPTDRDLFLEYHGPQGTPPTNRKSSSIEQEAAMTPEETVRAQLDAWGRLDVDEIMSFFTEDIVLDFVPFGPVVGREKVRKAVEAYVGRMTSGEIELLNLAVAGNVVLTERIDHFCWDGEMFHSRCMGTLEIVGDKICAWRDYFDMSKGGH